MTMNRNSSILSIEQHQPNFKSTHLSSSSSICLIKDLRQVNLLNEFYPFKNENIHVQETVEIYPQPVSCERIFYSYIDNRTDLRSREDIQFDKKFYPLFSNFDYNQRFKLDFYSTTLFIFPKQRNEKFISEIRYIPEHITIRYKTSLELLSATFSSSSEHYYENLDNFQRIIKDILYRI